MKSKEAGVTQKKTYWQEHIKAWRQSGLSQAHYCKARSLALSTFHYWRRKINQGSNDPPRFFPLAVMPSIEALDKSSPGKLRVIVGDRRFVLEIGEDFSETTLKKLIVALEQL
jgi:hypothetical protein